MLDDSPIFFYFTYTVRAFGKLWRFGSFGVNTSQGIPLVGMEKSKGGD
jgi:hypothetical protein